MLNFIEKRFPEDIAYASAGGPEFSTDILMTVGGHEQRNINWSDARCRYDITAGITSKDQLNELTNLFRVCRGKAIGFRFKDFADYSAENELLAISDGMKNEFQLIKTYQFNDQKYVRTIYKPVEGSVKIYLDNKLIDFTCDYQTGKIGLNIIPEVNQLITASFEFDVPVRFDIDRLSIRLEDYGNLNSSQIMLIEIKTH